MNVTAKAIIYTAMVSVGLIGMPTARAEVIAEFQGTIPQQDIGITQGSTVFGTMPIGPFRYVTTAASTDARFQGEIRSFCAELFQDVEIGTTYTYTVGSIGAIPTINGNASKIALIQELYDKFYAVATDATKGAAFQLLQWEIISDGGNGIAGVDLDGGSFRVNAGDTSTGGALAKTWISQLGAPNGPAQLELVSLLNGTAQDQIAVVDPKPVPAPAGMVLGLFAMGVLGARRWVRKNVA
jgi:hypothetical protein